MKDKKEELKEVLKVRLGYLKKGPAWLANKYSVTIDEARECLKDAKNAFKEDVNEIDNYDTEDLKRYIPKQSVKANIVAETDVYKLLILSDLHSIFLDQKAWAAVLSVVANNYFHEIVINGDLMDFPLLSKHDKKLFAIPIMEGYSEVTEIEFVKAVILEPLRNAAPNSRIVVRLGNHEERLTEGKYSSAAERIAKVFKYYKTSELEEMLELESLAIEYDPSTCRSYFDTFDIVHGLSLAKTASRNNIYTYMSSGTSGHSHRLNSTYIRNKKASYMWIESGCLRTLDDVEYLPTATIADWMQGFVTVSFDTTNGNFFAKTHPIVEGSCEFDGILYK